MVNRSSSVPETIADGWRHLLDHLDDLVRLGEQSRRPARKSSSAAFASASW